MRTIDLKVTVTLDEEAAKSLVELAGLALSKAGIADEVGAGNGPVSQNANVRGQKPSEVHGLLIDKREAARLLKVSPRTLYGMYSTGKMPATIHLGSLVRFGYEELRAWVIAGCPRMEEWKYEPVTIT